MNTIEQPVPDIASDVAPAETPPSESIVSEPAINGFDGGTRPIFKEPSLYLSIAIVLIATSVCLSKTPTVFWSSLAAMTIVAVMFHILAERFLFSAAKEHHSFAAPFRLFDPKTTNLIQIAPCRQSNRR